MRPQKNHELLIEAAHAIIKKYPDWSFHLIGKDFEDEYSRQLRKKVNDLKLQKNVFFYGSSNNVSSALAQSQIAVLSSLSEGLPLAILEYGLHKLPVVATNVGQVAKVITSETEGLVVESNHCNEFVEAIERLILDKKLRDDIALALHHNIQLNFSETTIIKEYLLWLKSLTNFAI